jgi:uncharacterized protein (DUF302 family)
MTPAGLNVRSSPYGARQTIDRLVAEVTARGMAVFARIDHAAGAAEVGMPLRPTELLIFGAAKGGTPLMQSAQTIGIDLPLKMLAWDDESGQTRLAYNEPQWLAERHGVAAGEGLERMSAMLNAVAEAVVAPASG